MAKDKESKRKGTVKKSGNKYLCGECGYEVEFGHDCPTCRAEFDWKTIESQVRRY